MKGLIARYRRAAASVLGHRTDALTGVTFFVTRGHEYTVNLYLQYHGPAISRWVRVVSYESVRHFTDLGPSQVYVFTDLERLDRDGIARATAIWDALGEIDPAGLRLNHPIRARRRYELLRLLDAKGLNPFRAYRLTEFVEPRTFPVFLRREDDHAHEAPKLLATPAELSAAAEAIDAQGAYRDHILVVEFLDTSDPRGLFRRYSSFNVSGEIIHRHLALSKDWFCKGEGRIHGEAPLKEEMAFIDSDAYKDEIAEIFRLARLDYGRIDFSLVDGRIVTWEINTAPAIMPVLGPNVLHDVVGAFSKRFNAAFARLAQLPCACRPEQRFT